MVLGSFSTFASDECGYALIGTATEAEKRMAERVLSDKGYIKTDVLEDTRVIFKVGSSWTGQVQGANYSVFGDTKASAKLIRAEDLKVIASATRKGSLGVVAGLGNDLKAKLILKKAIKSLPECEEYNNL